jgi:hypothetical protein
VWHLALTIASTHEEQMAQELHAVLQVRPADGEPDRVPGGLVRRGRQHLAELRPADGDAGRAALHPVEHQRQQQHRVRPLAVLLINI